VVDAPRALPEFNEANNVYEQSYTAPPQQVPTATQPTPTPPTPSQAQPDLTVSAIRIDGRAPDGKDDCQEGKNDVAVVVKNAGAAKADFAVRLGVDGNDDEAKEKSVDGLDAGQEHQVRFDDVRLKKGERTLLAIADPKNAITEAKEDNNELKVTARCNDD
jgi:subtilase family serine protease